MSEENIVELVDKNGKKIRYEFLDYVTLNDDKYVVLVEANDSAEEVLILKVEPIDDEYERYVSFNDPAICDAVFADFKARNADRYKFDI